MTFTEQTGHRRRHPAELCQDLDVLAKAWNWTFNLGDLVFVEYFQKRTGIMITWSPRSTYQNPEVCSLEEWDQICRDIMHGKDTADHILRSKLEDVWEIWNDKSHTPNL
jgi:hypothetical protein